MICIWQKNCHWENLESLINGLPESDIQNVSDDVAKQHRLKLYKAGSVVFAKSGMSCMKGYVYSLITDCFANSEFHTEISMIAICRK